MNDSGFVNFMLTMYIYFLAPMQNKTYFELKFDFVVIIYMNKLSPSNIT